MTSTVKNKPFYPKGFTLARHRMWWRHATVWHSKYVIIFPTLSNTALNLISLLIGITTIIRSGTMASCSSLLSHLPLSWLPSALLLDYSQVHYKQLSFVYETLLVSHNPLWCHIFHIFFAAVSQLPLDHAKPKCFAMPFSKNPFKKSLTSNHTALWSQLSVKLAHVNTAVMISHLLVTPCPSFQLPVYTLHTTKISLVFLGPEDRCSKLLQSAGNYLPIDKVS